MKKIYNTVKTAWQELRNFLKNFSAATTVVLNEKEREMLREIEKRGFFVISDFCSKETCSALQAEIDALISKYKNQIQEDETGSDHRIWGADKASPIILEFFTDPFLRKIVRAHQKTDAVIGFTLAARLDFKLQNLGSGGGWHRDTAHEKQIKAILYVSDVDKKSGPFQYIKKSHRSLSMIQDTFIGNFEVNQNRFTDLEIQKWLGKIGTERIETFTAKAGTLILVNTRGVHRGMPIEAGSRYALTNYYWTKKSIPPHLAKLLVNPHQL